jgi:hypothetical protein
MSIIWEKITNTSDKPDEGDEPITMVHDYVDPDTDILHHYEIKPGKSIRVPFVGLHRLFQNLYPAKYIKVEQIEAPEGELEPWGDAIHPVWSNEDWTEQVSADFGGTLTVKKGLSFWDKDRFTFLILPLGGGRTLTGSAAIKKAIEEDALPESAYEIAAQYGFRATPESPEQAKARLAKEEESVEESKEPEGVPEEEPEETLDEKTEGEPEGVPPEETPEEKPDEESTETSEEESEEKPEEGPTEPEDQFTIAEWGKRYRASKGISNKEIADMEEYVKGTPIERFQGLYTRSQFLNLWIEFCKHGGEE